MRISIKKFQELYSISLVDTDELSKSSLLVQCLTGMNEEQVNQLPIDKYNKLCGRILNEFKLFNQELSDNKPKQFVWLKGKLYYFVYDIKKMNAAKYVEIATYSQDVIGNLHRIMATMCKPVKMTWKGLKVIDVDSKNHEEISNELLELDFSFAYHSSVFFWAVLTESMKSLSTYSNQKEEEAKEVISNLKKVSDGYITAKWYQSLRTSA